MVHRDIKPENILANTVTRGDNAVQSQMFKLTDFGLAQILPPDGMLCARRRTHLGAYLHRRSQQPQLDCHCPPPIVVP